MLVTEETLRALAKFAERRRCHRVCRSKQRDVPLMMPRIGSSAKGMRPVLPTHWAYAEIGRLDPDGRGDVGIELRAGPCGAPVAAHPARHGGQRQRHDRPGHQQLLRRRSGGDACAHDRSGPGRRCARAGAAGCRTGPITRILVTHTHKDHSPAAHALKAATQAPLFGRVADFPPNGRTARSSPTTCLKHGERIAARRRHHAARDPHAGPRVEPPVLPARAGKAAVHRRPPDAGLDRRDQSARRRHAGLPAIAALAARRRPRMAGAGPRLPDRSASRGGAQDGRAPPAARGQGGGGHSSRSGAATSTRCCRWCTPTCRRACTPWRRVRCARIC